MNFIGLLNPLFLALLPFYPLILDFAIALGNKRGIQVNGLGIGDMTRIFFDSQDYLPYNSTFFLARWSVIQACEDYYPEDIQQCDSVRNAFAIVGIGDPAYQPTLVDHLSGFFYSIQDQIITIRGSFYDALFERLDDLGVQIDDYLMRAEEDLFNLFFEILTELVTKFFFRSIVSILESTCNSLLLVILPSMAIFFVYKPFYKTK